MRMYGRLALHAESVVLPLLAPDAPVVTWWHGATPDKLAWDALGVLAGRRVTDATTDDDSVAALKRRAKDYAPGDTDLAWTRTTPWRALLASAFDDMADTPTSAEVHAERGNPSAALLAGWLVSRLGIKVKRADSAGPGLTWPPCRGPASRTASCRSSGVTWASCWPRSCAGWTPTSRTPMRWRTSRRLALTAPSYAERSWRAGRSLWARES